MLPRYLLARLASLLLLAAPRLAHAQTGSVGIGTTTPAPSAALEVRSTTQGLLPPRLTAAQRQAIASPAQGLEVFQTDGTQGLYYYSGVAWVNLTTGRVPDATGSTVPANGGVVSTLAGLAGSTGNADGTGAAARFNQPTGVAVDAGGTLYVTDYSNHTIRKITPAGVVSTLAGTAGSSGSADGSGAAARFYYPKGMAVDAAGTVYVADQSNHTIRRITSAGVVSTLAGTAGSRGSADGTGAAASFFNPSSVAVDAAGTLYVADYSNQTIRRITPAGVVSTLAGVAGSVGSTDGAGAAARFSNPAGVAVDAGGTLYVADQNASTIRRITPAGVVSTLAGTAGSSGSTDGAGAAARFNRLTGVAVDAAGTVYVADQSNGQVRVIR
jgi:sugar lactone lactonase YvrE